MAAFGKVRCSNRVRVERQQWAGSRHGLLIEPQCLDLRLRHRELSIGHLGQQSSG